VQLTCRLSGADAVPFFAGSEIVPLRLTAIGKLQLTVPDTVSTTEVRFTVPLEAIVALTVSVGVAS
jgi:hypothetical protein